MGFVSCPNCDEDVRLPSAELPEGFSAQCPWCSETFSLSQWNAKLPPAVKLIDPDGVAVEWCQAVGSDNVRLVEHATQADQDEAGQDEAGQHAVNKASLVTDANLVADDPGDIDSLELEIEPYESEMSGEPNELLDSESGSISPVADPQRDDELDLTQTQDLDLKLERDAEQHGLEESSLAESASDPPVDDQDELILASPATEPSSDEKVQSGFQYEFVDPEAASLDEQLREPTESEPVPVETAESGHAVSDMDAEPEPPALSSDEVVEEEDEDAVERFLQENVFEENVFDEASSLDSDSTGFDESENEESDGDGAVEFRHRLRVPLASEREQVSYYQRHQWSDEDEEEKQLSRYVIPALLSVPIAVAGIVYAIGWPSFGFSSSDKLALSEARKTTSGSLPPGSSGSSVTPSLSDSSLSDTGPNGAGRFDESADALGNRISTQTASTENELAQTSQVNSETADEAKPSRYVEPIVDFDEWVDSVINGDEDPAAKVVVSSETADESGEEGRVTSTPLAELMRSRSAQIAAEKANQRTPEVQRKNLEPSLSGLPKNAPKVAASSESRAKLVEQQVADEPSGILQASASAESASAERDSAVGDIKLPAQPSLPADANLEDLPPLPKTMSELPKKVGGNSAPGSSSSGAVFVDSFELQLACATSLESLGQFQAILESAEPVDPNKKNKAMVRAYRDLAIIGSMDFDASSAVVSRVMSRLANMDILSAMGPLGSIWVRYPKRTTDGILLVGKLRGDGSRGTIQLPDGGEFDVRYETVDLPEERNVYAIGRIITTGDSPRVRLVAGDVFPSPP